jgi:hypothetical protein
MTELQQSPAIVRRRERNDGKYAEPFNGFAWLWLIGAALVT